MKRMQHPGVGILVAALVWGSGAGDSSSVTAQQPAAPEASAAEVQISRLARRIGEVEKDATWAAPVLEAYPMQVTKSSEKDGVLQVTIAVRNASGRQWKSAYIILAAPDAPKAQRYEISDWRVDEIIGLRYECPKADAAKYMANLRIVSIQGQQQESPLQERITTPAPTASPVMVEGDERKAGKFLYRYNDAIDLSAISNAPASAGAARVQALGYGTVQSTEYFGYDPAQGTVSAGDVWRVKNGDPSAGAHWVTPGNEAEFSTERYKRIDEQPYKLVAMSPLSTFSIDVDRASYSNVRRILEQGQLPPPGAVRIEEMINYFSYAYPKPTGEHPFSVSVEASECPWELEHRLVRIGLRGMDIDVSNRPASNLVFLIDVSGSMNAANKLPLLVESLKLLVDQLRGSDKVSIVVYAGNSGLVLPATAGSDKAAITGALDRLSAGGSTNGGEGINLAYAVAKENFIKDGINRVLLCTDGDFNVGVTNESSLTALVEQKAKDGVFLSILGFGQGNFNDAMMEEISNKGNGNYAYIDRLAEARKVLVEEMSGTLQTIAKDVKIQVEFNPAQVKAYRLIGYENRALANEDFADDTKDAGEIGAGHTVTAFYEIVPPGASMKLPEAEELKYQTVATTGSASGELMTVKLRYKQPDGDTSQLLEVPVTDKGTKLTEASDDFVFAASVASFGMLLRESQYQGLLTMEGVAEMSASSKARDEGGHRAEFAALARKAAELRAAAEKKEPESK